MLTGEPVEPQVRICYPSFDMAGVGKHVKNGQGNHHITFQAKVSDRFPSLQKLRLQISSNFKDTPSRKYSKSAARASGLHEMYRILGFHSTHPRTSGLNAMPFHNFHALLPTPCHKGADPFLPQLYVSAHRCLRFHLSSLAPFFFDKLPTQPACPRRIHKHHITPCIDRCINLCACCPDDSRIPRHLSGVCAQNSTATNYLFLTGLRGCMQNCPIRPLHPKLVILFIFRFS